MLSKKVIEKYNVSSPRYTSYPTILDWNKKELESKELAPKIKTSFSSMDKIKTSVYIHLPFCESLCTFCGCYKHITKNHTVEDPYINALIKEWKLYHTLAEGKNIEVEELHLGGGTPTFFSTSQLKRLLAEITKNKPENFYYSIEGHPNNTTSEHLSLFREFGFKRISFGVQDYSPIVQKAINRIQTYEQVAKVTDEARKLGFTSISHDLVFGLPKQTFEGLKDSILKTIHLKPDSISLYSYAHVPWVKGTGQRGFDESDLPTGTQKRKLYEMAKEMLLDTGYEEIGMDHFGLKHEPLTLAKRNKTMTRNFMGYTTAQSKQLIGLGVSAISEYSFGYAQNVKSVKEYHELIDQLILPTHKGHFHSETDIKLKAHIENLMCKFETKYEKGSLLDKLIEENKKILYAMEEDVIIKTTDNKIKITEDGQPFVRNVCMILDPYNNVKTQSKRFSSTV